MTEEQIDDAVQEGLYTNSSPPRANDDLRAAIDDFLSGVEEKAEDEGQRDETMDDPEMAGYEERASEKKVGKRADGTVIYQDKNGVRFYIADGRRVQQKVRLIPTQGGMTSEPAKLTPEFMTSDELWMADKPKAPPPKAPPPPPKAPKAKANTIFTEDEYQKAKAELLAKLRGNTLNAGLDPDMLRIGITMTGYHIEKGARTFAAYARAMLADMGDAVKPYLKQWYAATYFDQRVGPMQADMTSPGDLASADIPDAEDTTNEQPDEAPELDQGGKGALGGASSDQVRGPRKVRSPRGGAGGGRGGNVGGNRRPDVGRGGLDPGVGNDQGEVPVPAGGSAPDGVTTPEPQFVPDDFTIEDDLELGEGGQRTKYRRNVDAIKLLKQLDAEGRMATPDEQRVLALYVGWGGISQAFDENNADWAKQYAELRDLLTSEEYEAAAESTQYAHYTSREVITAMYNAVRRMGFTGGRVLEAGGGVGNFIGLMPKDMRTGGRFTLVERERIASGIARHLYPQQNVMQADYRAFGEGEDGVFDMVIGNPPFGSTPLTDLSGRKHLTGLSIHNYFIAKGIDLLREGGILVNVVSNGFLDAGNDVTRRYINDRAEFLGAIRLPNDAFKGNAGTEVTTDIVFFRKRPEAEVGSKKAKAEAKSWVDSNEAIADDGNKLPLNQYFIDNRAMMLGEWGAFGTMYRGDMPALVSRKGQDLAQELDRAVKALPNGIYVPRAVSGTAAAEQALRVSLHDTSVKIGSFYVHDGKLWQRVPNVAGEALAEEITPETQWTAKTKLGQSKYDAIVQLAELRLVVRQLFDAEARDAEADISRLRKEMNERYDSYVKDNGPINDRYTRQLIEDDPEYDLLAALEVDYEPAISFKVAKENGIKPTPATANKSDIFTQRVIFTTPPVTKAESLSDALNISIAERGQIDSVYIGELLGRDPIEAMNEMQTGDNPLLFVDPETQALVLRDEYLSGNVRRKLRVAEKASMATNVMALKRVLPPDRPASRISVNIGAPWVPIEVYEDFATFIFGGGDGVRVTRSALTNTFELFIGSGHSDANMMTTYGSDRVPANKLLEILMNKGSVRVVDYEADGTSHVNTKETEIAKERAQKIADAFDSWIMGDPKRTEIIVRAYNDANNNYVPRKFDGSWLRFPGKAPIELRKHQSAFVARVMQARTALADHVVGAGKTYAAIAAAMELKRTGLVRKSMIVVPNHLVRQWAKDVYKLYPGAKVLAHWRTR
jgi:hypothetical protein